METDDCKLALKLLVRSRNVLISGPPGTGKSKLLAEVALAFETAFGIAPAGGAPKLNPVGGIPIPPAAGGAVKDIPAPTKTNRKVFRTVFHQNSKYRDFLSGITPAVNGTCPAGMIAVHRFYNNPTSGADINHRYVISPEIAAQMTAAGWIDEGVVMCAQP